MTETQAETDTTAVTDTEANRAFYDRLWADVRLVEPQRFNTWPVIEALAAEAPRRLEVGPGMRPRLPLQGTHFVDISPPALACLAQRGGLTTTAPISALPFADNSFDLVCALDIIEHVDDDLGALRELTRVAAPGATVLLSTPLHPEYWTPFDDLVGHRRRYRPEELSRLLADHGLTVERSAVFGMKPKSSRLVNLGMWCMEHKREVATWVYNRILMPMGLRFQKPLTLTPGMVPTEGVDDVFMVCRLAD